MIYISKLLYLRVIMGWIQKTLIKKTQWSFKHVTFAERKYKITTRGFILNILPDFKQLLIKLNLPVEIFSLKNTEIFIGFESLEDFYETVARYRKELKRLGFVLENNVPKIDENQFFSDQQITQLEEKFCFNLRDKFTKK